LDGHADGGIPNRKGLVLRIREDGHVNQTFISPLCFTLVSDTGYVNTSWGKREKGVHVIREMQGDN
jgi:hypothetical protein